MHVDCVVNILEVHVAPIFSRVKVCSMSRSLCIYRPMFKQQHGENWICSPIQPNKGNGQEKLSFEMALMRTIKCTKKCSWCSQAVINPSAC
jgi:hypothetical protein